MNLREVLAELEKLDTYDLEEDHMTGMFSRTNTIRKQTGFAIGDYLRREDVFGLILDLIDQYEDS